MNNVMNERFVPSIRQIATNPSYWRIERTDRFHKYNHMVRSISPYSQYDLRRSQQFRHCRSEPEQVHSLNKGSRQAHSDLQLIKKEPVQKQEQALCILNGTFTLRGIHLPQRPRHCLATDRAGRHFQPLADRLQQVRLADRQRCQSSASLPVRHCWRW